MAPLALLVHALRSLAAVAVDGGYDSAHRPTVKLSAGSLAGTSSGAVDRFLGVPFAAPPVRFEPPRQPAAWQGTYDASRSRPACVQKFNYPREERDRSMRFFNTPPPPAGESEDCLYLDVYVPAKSSSSSSAPKAVMFWLFGGGFGFGSGSLPLYDASSLAANHDVLVVLPNYRTNVFGFPGSPAKPVSQQNLGFLDQRMALDWVRRNIAAFGGDPARVTLFGESAGGGSVDVLVTDPPHPLPFAAAIMQSGQGSVALPNNKSAESWPVLAGAVGCASADLECMRRVPAARLKDAAEREMLSFAPIYDAGATYTGTGRRDRQASKPGASRIARVPVLVGSNADDGGVFVYGQRDPRSFLSDLLPPSATALVDRLLAAYPSDPRPGPVNQQLAKIQGDFAFTCPAKIVAEEGAAAGIPSWRYYYDAGFPNDELYPGSGAYHSAELLQVFGTYPRPGATRYQDQLSRDMQKAWTDFAKNPSVGPGWAPAPKVGVFGAGVRPGGSDGAGKPSLSVQDPGSIDRNCALYKSIYDADAAL